MNKIILVLALVLTPFFSSANIFENGAIDLKHPKVESMICITAKWGLSESIGCGDTLSDAKISACSAVASSKSGSSSTENWPNRVYSQPTCKAENNSYYYYHDVTTSYRPDSDGEQIVYGPTPTRITSSWFRNDEAIEETKICPPEGSPLHIIYVPTESGLMCGQLSDIQANDTCDFNDVYSNPVTESNACIVKSDGSMCGVSAVDIGGGNSAYMPNENDCYSDVYPILDENGGIGNMPDGSDQQCTESGALQYCPAIPDEVCPDGQCDAGCGYMNDVMICVSPIEIPEECTGDDCDTTTPPPGECTGDDCDTTTPPPGECTGDDCDTTTPPPSECTGDDCDTTTPPPSECTGDDCGSGGGTGEGEGFCDTEGNCSTGIVARTEPSEGLKGFWKTKYPDGVEGMFEGKVEELKQTEFYTFLQEFQPDIDSGSAPMFNFCFNFGSFGNYGCQEISIDPRVFPALKIFMLISAGFACRIILFGG